MWKPAKVVMLSTDQKATIVLNPTTSKIQYNDILHNAKHYTDAGFKVFDLYIVSDEEIKEGDWCYHIGFNRVEQWTNKYQGERDISLRKKIIVTTDVSLTDWDKIERDNLEATISTIPQPLQSFINKYITEYNKSNVITDVMVEYITNNFYERAIGLGYEIVPDNAILKINPSNNTINIQQIKDSYTREEVEKLMTEAYWRGCDDGSDDLPSWHTKKIDEWIKEKLQL